MEERKRLVEKLKNEGYIKTKRVEKAFLAVPRENFIPPSLRREAYLDCPLPTFAGQTISAPHMVAKMTEVLEPRKNDKVLEIGSGSGYQAAILSTLVKVVYTIEINPQLVEFARANLARCGIKNVVVIHGDGSKGYEKEKPYDKIIVTCATPKIFERWVEQLKEGGKIVAPVEAGFHQMLIEARKEGRSLKKIEHIPCVFVPLRRH